MAIKMKDSGVDWIGEIPNTWDLIKVKNRFSTHKEIVGANEFNYERLSLTLNGVLKRSKEDTTGLQSESLSTYQILYKGELVFKMIDLANISTSRVGYSPYTGIVSPVYIILKNDDYAPYAYYFFYSMWQRNIFNQLGNNGIRSALNANDMLNLPFPNISISEANDIANFLRINCFEIDKALICTKSIIEDYNKYKQSLITETVTRGLQSNIETKGCKLDWIDRIPKDWSITRLKYLFTFGKGLPITKENLIETGVPVISYGQIHAKDNPGTRIISSLYRYVSPDYLNTNVSSLVENGDFLVADTSEDLDGCGDCVYVDTADTLFAGYHTIILKSIHNRDNRYLAYLFKTDAWRSQIRKQVFGIKVYSITQSILRTLTVILPPESEQEEIVNYLDAKCTEIDKLIAAKEAIIEDLEAYKKSLIYEYVTGKKEVI